MLSLGTGDFLAFWMASYSVGLPAGSPPPTRAATSMFLISLANILPRLASMTAFLCLVVAHLEWPLVQVLPLGSVRDVTQRVYWVSTGPGVRTTEPGPAPTVPPEVVPVPADRRPPLSKSAARRFGRLPASSGRTTCGPTGRWDEAKNRIAATRATGENEPINAVGCCPSSDDGHHHEVQQQGTTAA